jgi:hypothetical protein
MIVRETFNLQPQYCLPRFVPIEVRHEETASIPEEIPVLVNGCEHVKQVLDVGIL